MVHFRLHLLIFAAVFSLTSVSATKVAKCELSDAPAIDNVEVVVSACDGPPCILKRKTEPKMSIKFTPNMDVPNVVRSVHGVIVGVPFPYIGVDGTTGCDNLYKEDGETKAECPLKKGETYVFKDQFKILEIYPKIKVTIRYGLMTGTGDNAEHLLCFELPAKIA